MLSTDEVENRIKNAEQHIRNKIFAKEQAPLLEIVNSLNESGATAEMFPPATVLRLATVLRDMGKGLDDEDGAFLIAQAQEVVKKGCAWHPNDMTLVNEKGNLDYSIAHYDKALESFDIVIKKDPPADNVVRALALESAGASLRELRRLPEANDMLKQALALTGSPSIKLLIERGWLRFYQERYDLALTDFAEAHNRTDANDENKNDAIVGQIASRQALEAMDPEAKQDRAKVLRSDWEAVTSGLSKPDAISILFECDSIHTELNLYPAALLNCDLLLEVAPTTDKAKASCLKIAALKWLRHFDEAEKFYRSAQAMFPDNIELWKEMGNVYYQQKRFDDAHKYYSGKALNDADKTAQNNNAFIDLLKKDAEANEWTIASLRRMRNLKDARTLVDTALAVHGDKANLLSEKAVIDFTERKYDSAIKFFDCALVINEYYDFAQQWRAASYRKKPDLDKKTPDLDKAKTEIEKALAKLPAATGLLEERAWLALDQGDLKLADEYFSSAVKLDPYLIQRQFSRIEVLARLNLWDDALDVFDNLEKQFPNDPEVGEQKCWFYLRLGRLDDARDHLEAIEEQHGDNVLIINARGGYELEQRNYAAAEKLFRRAIEKVNYEPQYHINLAWALLRQVKDPGEMPRADRPKREKLIDEARRSCRRALEFDPYSAKANGCLGVIAYKRNAFLDAEAYFRKSIELSPPEGNFVELAALYCQMGRYEDATISLTTAIKFNQNDARAYIELGNVSVLAQNNNEAVRQCRAAIIVEPKNAEAHRALAIALMRSEKYDEAETTLRKALNTVAPHCQSQLYLLLSQILIRSGDLTNKEQKKKDFDLYDEALKYVKAAKQDTFTANADIFFHAGVVHYKLEDYRASQENFAACFKTNSDRHEAQRYSRVVQAVLDQEKRLFKVNKLYGYMLAGVCILMLAGLWVPYYAGFKRTILVTPPAATNSAPDSTKKREPQDEFLVDRSLLTVMTPILLGLLVVAALLPNLNKLKLPGGFEAEISEPKAAESNISSGPRGDIGFGTSLPVVSPEPR